MALLVEAILRVLGRALLRKGVEGTGSLTAFRAFRVGGAVIIAAISIWVAVASALLWTSTRVPGVHGLWQYVLADGGPIWELALPVVAGPLVVLMLVLLPGKFSLGLYLSAAVFGLTLGALAEFQGGGQYQTNDLSVYTMLPTFLLVLLGAGLALGDVPPLDAPLAPLAPTYGNRRKHLLALAAYAHQRGLAVTGPGGKGATLTLEGRLDAQHSLTITSAKQMSARGLSTFILSVKMTSPRDIVACRISYHAAPRNANRPIYAGEARGPRGRPIVFYLAPEHGEQLPASFMAHMAYIVEAGRPFIGREDFLHATPWGMRYTHVSHTRLTAAEAQLDPLLAWMRQLIGLLEDVSPGPQTVYGEQSSTGYPSGDAPYPRYQPGGQPPFAAPLPPANQPPAYGQYGQYGESDRYPPRTR